MSPAYAAAVEGLATPGMLVLMLAAIIVGAAIGAWLGSPLWKRGQARIHIRRHEPYRNTAERKCRMKTKRENPLKVLFSFSGEARGKMTGLVILAFIGEMFGMAPLFCGDPAGEGAV